MLTDRSFARSEGALLGGVCGRRIGWSMPQFGSSAGSLGRRLQ